MEWITDAEILKHVATRCLIGLGTLEDILLSVPENQKRHVFDRLMYFIKTGIVAAIKGSSPKKLKLTGKTEGMSDELVAIINAMYLP